MKINYLLEGEGERTIVFIHGLSDSLLYWVPLTAHLKKDFKILTYDLRGHGESELGPGPFTIDMLAEDLHSLFMDLDISKATVVGMSLGGNVALYFTLTYPELVEKLILMSTYSEVDSKLHSHLMEFRDALDVSFEEFYDTMIEYVLPEDLLLKHKDDLIEIKKELTLSENITAIRYAIDMGMHFNVTSRLSEIDCHTLIFSGREDELTPVKLQEIIKDNIRNSQMKIFENSKHNLLIGRDIYTIINLIQDFI